MKVAGGSEGGKGRFGGGERVSEIAQRIRRS